MGYRTLGVVFRAVFFAIRVVLGASPGLFVVSMLATLVFGLVPAAEVYVAKLVLNATVEVLRSGAVPSAVTPLVKALTLQLGVLVGNSALRSLNTYAQFSMGRQLMGHLEAEFLRQTKTIDYARFEDARFHDMMSRARREWGTRPLELLTRTTGIASGMVTFLSLACVIAALDVMLLGALVIVCFPMLIVQIVYGSKAYSLEFSRTDARRKVDILSTNLTGRQTVPQIASFGLFDYLFDKWLSALRAFLRQDVNLRRRRILAESLSGLMVTAATVSVTGYVVYLSFARHLSLTVGDVTMYAAAFGGSLVAWQSAITSLSGIYEGSLFLHDLVAFQRLKPERRVSGGSVAVPEVIREICLDNVSYRYPGSAAWVLRNLDLTFRRSESTLLVGRNGAGKTTLVKLLIRLYDPTEGRILIDGVDIRQFDPQSLRQRIGVVFQDFLMLPFTAQENIGCGDLEHLENLDRVRQAAERAGADEFIRRLPLGYGTVLSKLFKDGSELSYGQWQRVCIARLFMKHAPVCIWDEPTASLDVEAEANLLREIAQLSLASISVLISHRALRPGIAARIVLLSSGCVAEEGDYDTLIRQNGEFARLCRLYQDAAAINPVPVAAANGNLPS